MRRCRREYLQSLVYIMRIQRTFRFQRVRLVFKRLKQSILRPLFVGVDKMELTADVFKQSEVYVMIAILDEDVALMSGHLRYVYILMLFTVHSSSI